MHVEPSFVGGQAGGEGDAAAAGHVGVADAVGVDDVRAARLRRAMPSVSASCMAMLVREPPMSVEPSSSVTVPSAFTLAEHARLQPDVEPEAGRDAAAAVRAGRACVL